MAMEKAVIATNFSGPTAYLTDQNSYPLRYEEEDATVAAKCVATSYSYYGSFAHNVHSVYCIVFRESHPCRPWWQDVWEPKCSDLGRMGSAIRDSSRSALSPCVSLKPSLTGPWMRSQIDAQECASQVWVNDDERRERGARARRDVVEQLSREKVGRMLVGRAEYLLSQKGGSL